eukprot:COSAG01_NODE_3087_length_6609_cov_2.598925_5_plen_180_part_00
MVRKAAKARPVPNDSLRAASAPPPPPPPPPPLPTPRAERQFDRQAYCGGCPQIGRDGADSYSSGWVAGEEADANAVTGSTSGVVLHANSRLRLYLMSLHAVSPKLFSMFDYLAKPFSNAELLFASAAEFGSLIIFGWLTSSLNTYLSTGKLATQEFRHRMDLLKVSVQCRPTDTNATPN